MSLGATKGEDNMPKSYDEPVRKISVSFPADLVKDLDEVSYALGVSRSAFLSSFLGSTLPSVRDSVFTAYLASRTASVASNEADPLARTRYRSASKGVVDDFLSRFVSGGADDQ